MIRFYWKRSLVQHSCRPSNTMFKISQVLGHQAFSRSHIWNNVTRFLSITLWGNREIQPICCSAPICWYICLVSGFASCKLVRGGATIGQALGLKLWHYSFFTFFSSILSAISSTDIEGKSNAWFHIRDIGDQYVVWGFLTDVGRIPLLQ